MNLKLRHWWASFCSCHTCRTVDLRGEEFVSCLIMSRTVEMGREGLGSCLMMSRTVEVMGEGLGSCLMMSYPLHL